jgi:transposase
MNAQANQASIGFSPSKWSTPKNVASNTPFLPIVLGTAATGFVMLAAVFSGGSGSHSSIIGQVPARFVMPNGQAIGRNSEQIEVFETQKIRSVTEQVVLIRTVFGLNISDVANLFDVSRPTIYSWLKGIAPQGEALIKLNDFSKVSDRMALLELTRSDTLIKRPMFSGKTPFEILKKERELSDIQLQAMDALSKKEAAIRSEAKGFGVVLRHHDDVLEEAGDVVFGLRSENDA